jgi:hypothetical protein
MFHRPNPSPDRPDGEGGKLMELLALNFLGGNCHDQALLLVRSH